jgi:group I intron endonuclease
MAKNVMGVYSIQSISIPSRVYIGSGVSIYSRWGTHKSLLKRGKHHSIKLQRHYDKYGWNDLSFEIIECGKYVSNKHLLAREQMWYDRFCFDGNELPYFNISKIAGAPMAGLRHKPETIEKFKNHKASPETRKKQSDSQKRIGNKPPSATGRKQSEETRKKHGDASRGNKVWLGKKHKPETIAKMKESAKNRICRKGFKQSPEWVKKRTEHRKGKKKTPEQIKNSQNALIEWYETHDSPLKGRKRPKEVVDKIQEAIRRAKVTKKLAIIMQSLIDFKNNQ